MSDLNPDNQAYQLNKRRMAWTALGMMIVSTIAVLLDPARIGRRRCFADVWVAICTCRCLLRLPWFGC
jgi:hypothetical protein